MSKGNSVSRVRNVKLEGKPIRLPGKLPWPRAKIDEETGKRAVGKDGLPIQLGVDVSAKRKDIIKITHKYFRVSEVPMEELLQEVFMTIIHKNHGRSAHDPTKSSFGHYVYMVANNVCINLVHRKKRFEKERDSIDSPYGEGDSRTLLDTVEAPDPENDPFHDKMEELESVMRKKGMWDLARYIRVARSGASSAVVREALSWGGVEVTNKMIRELRHRLQEAAGFISVQNDTSCASSQASTLTASP